MDDFNKLLEKATNDELKGLWQQVMSMDFIGKWDCLTINVTNAFTREIKKRLNNDTMKSELSDFPTDWELFVSNCKD